MRVLVQRVSAASVSVEGHVVAEIGHGLLLFVGIAEHDGEPELTRMVDKVTNLRIFEDACGRMNLSALDVKAEHQERAGMLVVSQFTLYGDVARGRRPSFVRAATPEHAAPMIERFMRLLVDAGFRTERGVFGADMAVSLVNDGPVTIWIDSDDLRRASRQDGKSA